MENPKKNKTKTLVLLAVVGAGAYFLLSKRKNTGTVPYTPGAMNTAGGFVGPGMYQVQQPNGNWVTALINNADELIAATAGLINTIHDNNNDNNNGSGTNGPITIDTGGGRSIIAGYLNDKDEQPAFLYY